MIILFNPVECEEKIDCQLTRFEGMFYFKYLIIVCII